jgi:GNAT superfamily N-acetyltransferase
MLRIAEEKDVASIHALICALAAYEREPDAVINTIEELHYTLFIEKHAHTLVWEDLKAGVVGFALYFYGYSTWKGKTVYLEDLYVNPEFREQKIGEQLFDAVVAVAKKQKVRRMDWQVLEWNTPAIKFYEKKKALLDGEWVNGRLFFD